MYVRLYAFGMHNQWKVNLSNVAQSIIILKKKNMRRPHSIEIAYGCETDTIKSPQQ